MLPLHGASVLGRVQTEAYKLAKCKSLAPLMGVATSSMTTSVTSVALATFVSSVAQATSMSSVALAASSVRVTVPDFFLWRVELSLVHASLERWIELSHDLNLDGRVASSRQIWRASIAKQLMKKSARGFRREAT